MEKETEVLQSDLPVESVGQGSPKKHFIKRDRFQYVVFHPWGDCKQRRGDRSGMKYTYITQKENLPWELNQCGISPEEQSQLLASA